MGLKWDMIRHPLRYKDLWDAANALKSNWRNPDMGKYLQREYLLPVFTAIAVVVAGLMGYDLTPEQMGVLAGMCATAMAGIVLRKSILGPTAGLGKLGEREFLLPVFGELVIFADRIFELGMTPDTMLYLAGTIAGIVAGLLGRKKAIVVQAKAKNP